MKNVLVLMHDDEGQEARFQAALDLTRALDGHLTCVDISVLPASVGDYATLGGEALLIADEQQHERDNRARMEARLRVEGIPYDWIDTTGYLSPTIHDRAAMADLIVLNRELDGTHYPDMLEIIGETVLKTNKPIVAVPEKARTFNAFGNALIAWDGSEQAEAALRAAVPLLELARAVTILEVDDGSLAVPASEAAAYLSRHGIRPVIRRERSAMDIPSSVILAMIESLGADYLVMGGFGRSRFLEAAFGGVTRRMLKECPVPLFLAH